MIVLCALSWSLLAAEFTAFIRVHLVPMMSEEIIECQVVLIEGTRIVAVGSADTVCIPEGAHMIDGNGAYLMPGLCDMHMHTRSDWENREIWPVDPLHVYLAHGVTTIRDFTPSGSPLTYALDWRDEIRAGTRIGPAILASGELLYASPLDDPAAMVRRNHEMGFDFIKLYSYLTVEDFRDAMMAAKTVGMYTAGHIPYPVGLDRSLAEGMDEIVHVEELLFEFLEVDRDRTLSPDEWLTYIIGSAVQQWDFTSSAFLDEFQADNHATMDSIAERLLEADVAVCTTISVDEVIQWKLFRPEAFLARPENRFLPTGYIESFLRGEEKHQIQLRGMEPLAAFKYRVDRWVLSELHKAGVLLVAGTDAGTGAMGIVPGASLHDELQILIDQGFSRYEAIATSTVNAGIVAERMAGADDFGTIEVGKRADLLLVRGNPFEDLGTMREPLGVMAAGRWYSQEMLRDLVETPCMTATDGE